MAACTSLSRHSSDSATTYPAELDVVTRSDWGWLEPDKLVATHEISKITIHHGGETYDEGRDTREYLRSLQQWSRSSKGWMDIPYHFLIDLEGRVHEARPIQYPGDTNTEYDPAGHALIVVVGNYEEIDVSEKQLDALADVIAFLSNEHNVALDQLGAHKDYADTLCPGANLYRHLEDGTIESLVAKRLSQ